MSVSVQNRPPVRVEPLQCAPRKFELGQPVRLDLDLPELEYREKLWKDGVIVGFIWWTEFQCWEYVVEFHRGNCDESFGYPHVEPELSGEMLIAL